MTNIELKYIDNHLAVACSVFTPKTYESECIKELIELSLTNEFKRQYNYAIYTDDFQVASNMFIPQFHMYYLNTEKKDVILLDNKLLSLPHVFNHHNYYTYNDEELLAELSEKYPDIKFKNIKSIKEINNVSTDE